ncbi:hypothetical protein HHK36_003776 [Tetracentron sinense]|uniref:F-box domain-containing protein n=1 Tax=Tetracentron sinense TaxID=13715 RepID=A0A834ZPN4_TETSI|nr:hypothetical protein HHK36_003776 [Tetracentron sinense]
MALGKNCSVRVKRGNVNASKANTVEGGLGVVHYTRAMGRKRVAVSSNNEKLPIGSPLRTLSKKCCGARLKLNSEKSLLEALPQDILVQVLCGVDHDDLKQLFHVSKLIREATLIAKQWHFAYSTPISKIGAVRTFSNLEDAGKFDHHETPNAPKQYRCFRSPISGKKLADITVALFA